MIIPPFISSLFTSAATLLRRKKAPVFFFTRQIHYQVVRIALGLWNFQFRPEKGDSLY